MKLYIWWFMIAFIPCFMTIAVCVELYQRRQWGFWPWKIPLYRRRENK